MDELEMMMYLRPDAMPMPDTVTRHHARLVEAIEAAERPARDDPQVPSDITLAGLRTFSVMRRTARRGGPAYSPRIGTSRLGPRPRATSRAALAAGLAVLALVAATVLLHSPSDSVMVATTVQETSTAPVRNDAPIGLHLVLEETAVNRGAVIRGVVEVNNTTGHAVKVDACTTDSWPTVFLTNSAVQYQVPMRLGLCATGTMLPPGMTRRPVEISTMYPACTYVESEFPASLAMPYCPSPSDEGFQVPLPPGNYKTGIVMPAVSQDVALPAPADITIL